MSYSDPSRIRSHVVKVRFSDEEAALVDAWVNYTGEQKATLLRELILSEIAATLAAQIATAPLALPAPLQAAS